MVEAKVEQVLVNRDNFFLFTPMLHEVAASDLDITAIVNPYSTFLWGVMSPYPTVVIVTMAQ